MIEMRQFARKLFRKKTDVAISIAKFETLEKKDVSVRAVDISEGGLCVESSGPLEHGFVWFRDGMENHKGGVVVWSKALENNTCRAGIQFVSVGAGAEHSREERGVRSCLHSWNHPGLVASTLVDAIPLAE